MRKYIYLFLLLNISLAATAQSYIGPKEDIDKILISIDSFSYFFVNKMTDRLVGCYTENGKILPSGPPIMGGEAQLTDFWKPKGVNTVIYHKITPSEIRIENDIAYDYGYYEGRTRQQNGTLVSWKGKYVIIWHKIDGVWKIDVDIWNKYDLPEEISKFQTSLDSVYNSNPSSVGMLFHIEMPDKQISWSSAAGYAVEDSSEYLSPAAPVYIASNTKTFVAASILKLVEQGKLTIDQPINELLPEGLSELFDASGYQFNQISVRHLLSHTSGINDYVDDKYFNTLRETPNKKWSKHEQMKLSADMGEPYAPPGKQYAYGDINYLLLTEIIEQLTDLPFYIAIRKLIDYESLGMDHTYWAELEDHPNMTLPLAHQYNSKYKWDSYKVDPSFDLYGGGGLISTSHDLALFFQGLFNGKVIKDQSLIKEMITPVLPVEQSNYALGLMILDFGGTPAYYHGGYWGTNVMYLPEYNATISSFTLDRESRSINADLSKKIIKLLDKTIKD